MIPDDLKELLEKQSYGLVGNHSAAKICHWTKESIRGKGNCYKQQFYGVQSHRCLQCTPAVAWCNHRCTFCWRPIENTLGNDMAGVELDDPKFIVDGLIEQQRRLLMGFRGSETADPKKVEEAMNPNMAAISLAGEPTLYSDLGDFIAELKRRSFTTFLVTNGTQPDALENLSTEPDQLYVSLDAPNEQLYKKVDRPQINNGWARLKESLSVLSSLSPRTVLRLTLMRDTLVEPKQYSELIKLANPDFVECKAYMHVGFSRKRLQISDMPLHSEIVDFSSKISEFSGYELADQKQDSRVVLLKK